MPKASLSSCSSCAAGTGTSAELYEMSTRLQGDWMCCRVRTTLHNFERRHKKSPECTRVYAKAKACPWPLEGLLWAHPRGRSCRRKATRPDPTRRRTTEGERGRGGGRQTPRSDAPVSREGGATVEAVLKRRGREEGEAAACPGRKRRRRRRRRSVLVLRDRGYFLRRARADGRRVGQDGEG